MSGIGSDTTSHVSFMNQVQSQNSCLALCFWCESEWENRDTVSGCWENSESTSCCIIRAMLPLALVHVC